METIQTVLTFSDAHPVVATAFAATLIAVLITAYKLCALGADTLLTLAGRPTVVRTVKRGRPNRKIERPAVTGDNIGLARAALANLGYVRAEVEPVLATLDFSGPLNDVLRSAIRKLNDKSEKAVA